MSYADFLDRLLTEEMAAKSEKYVTMRTVMARFPYRKTLESFDGIVKLTVRAAEQGG